MKKIMVTILCIYLLIFFVSCTTDSKDDSAISDANNAVVSAENQNIESTPEKEYQEAVKSLDRIFASGEKYKCELIKNENDALKEQILFIDGENYRAYGYSYPTSQEVYNIIGNVTSNVVALRQRDGGFCTYLWSIAVNNEGTKKEKGMSGCKKVYNPPKPFEINDLFVGVFEGITPELIKTCVIYKQVVDYSVPSDQDFLDFSEMNLENV